MGTDFAGHEHVQTVKTRAHHYCSLGGSALSFLWAQKLLAHARTHTHTRHTHTCTETHANTRVSCNVGREGASTKNERCESNFSWVHGTRMRFQFRPYRNISTNSIKIYYYRTMPKNKHSPLLYASAKTMWEFVAFDSNTEDSKQR